MNWLRYRYCKRFNKPHLRFLMVQITERCNNKCLMCSTWRIKNPREMSIEIFEKILEESKLENLRSFGLMGGETYLYKDIVKATEILHKHYPNVSLFTSSNCYASELTVQRAKEMNDIMPLEFCASLDGLKGVHNRVRGTKDSFCHVEKTIHMLGLIGIKPFISFTIIPENFSQIVNVYNYAKERDMNFSCRPASVGVYFDNLERNFIFTENQKKKVYAQLKQIDYADHFLLYAVEQFLKNNRMFPCGAGYFSCYVTTNGIVYPCTHCPKEWVMGNLEDFNFNLEELLKSERARFVRKNFVDKCKACINDVEYCATYAMEQFSLIFWLLKRLSWKGKYNPKWVFQQIFKK